MNVYVSLWRITCALLMKNFNENRKITHKRKHVTREKTVKYPRQNTYIHIHTHVHEWESGKRDLIEQFKMLLTLRYLNIQTNFHFSRSSLTLRPFYARKQIFIPPYVFFKKFLKTNIHRVPLGVSIRRVVSLSLSRVSRPLSSARRNTFSCFLILEPIPARELAERRA